MLPDMSGNKGSKKPALSGAHMIAVYVLVGVLAVIASGFLAADISDADFKKRPENRNYD